MPKASRVAESSTSTSSASIVLSGSPLGRRTLASKHTVGETGIELVIEDTAGNWLEGVYTYTSANPTTMTRTAILSSSNNDADVTFPAGTKTVSETASAAYLNASSAIATTTVLGRVKVGSGLSIAADGTLSGSAGASGSARLVYTSSTCTSDTDLSFGSDASGTDQVVKLQALLDLAANGPLILVFDGAYTVGASSTTTSLRIRSNTKVMALPGCGAKMAVNSPVPMWRNYNPTVTPANIVDTNIEIYGGVWHGNSANQSVRETDANGGMSTFDFVGVNGLSMTGPHRIIKAKSFTWRATNCNKILIDGCASGGTDFGDTNTAVNTDGYHWNGPCRDIVVQNVILNGGADDALAFNADDGWNAPGIKPGPYVSSGAITDVLVKNATLRNYVCGIRMLSGGSLMDRFTFEKIRGSTGGYWLIVDNFIPAYTAATGPGNIGKITIRDVDVKNTPVSGWTQAQAHINCKVAMLIVDTVLKVDFNTIRYPAFLFGEKSNIGFAQIDKLVSRATVGGQYLSDIISGTSGAVIGTLKITNSHFEAPVGTNGYPITIPSGVSIGTLVGFNNTGAGYADFVSAAAGTVTNLQFPTASNIMGAGTASSSTWTLDPGYTEVSASALNFSGPLTPVEVARKTAIDTFNADIQLSTIIQFTGTAKTALNAALLVRGINLQPYNGANRNSYVLDISQIAGKVTLQRSSGGADTAIGSPVVVSGGLAMNTQYKVWLTAKVSALSGRVQRVSDSLYLQTNGTWAAAAVDCVSGTDTALGNGTGLQYGVYSYAYNSDSTVSGVQYTAFTAIAAP